MTFTEYAQLAIRTESTRRPLTKEVEELGLTSRTLHGIIGIETELVELHNAINNMDPVNATEEIGDILWFLAILADDNGITEDDIINQPDEEYEANSNMMDIVKSVMFYGSEMDKKKLKTYIVSNINGFLNLCEDMGVTYDTVLTANILKLEARYPDKFTENEAVMRDLKNERDVLEEKLSKANFNKFFQSVVNKELNKEETNSVEEDHH